MNVRGISDEGRSFVAKRFAALLLLLPVTATACSGGIVDGTGDRPPGMSGPATGGTTRPGESPATSGGSLPQAGAGTNDRNDFAVPAARLRRLTPDQVRNVLRDLVGDVSLPEVEAPEAIAGFASVGAAVQPISSRGVIQYEEAARSAIQQVLSEPTRWNALIGCTPGAQDGDPCVRGVLARFGKRAWRRPLTAAELDRYARLATTSGATLADPRQGLAAALIGMLQSPHFLYRVELGRDRAAGARWARLTGLELASRMSFLAWNSIPDDEGLAAAERGALDTTEGLRKEALRLLDSPRARDGLAAYLAERFDLGHLQSLAKDAKLFANFTPELRNAMRDEVVRRWEETFRTGGDAMELLATNQTFVNRSLARLYGVSSLVPNATETALVPVTLPADGLRAGLLGMGAVLALHAHENDSSPTGRGVFVREVLLCHEIPPPPPGVDVTLADPPKGVKLTLRQRLEQHRTPACAACHDLIDPLGFALENFDAVGTFRTMRDGLAIDASGNLDGVPFAHARELGARLRDSAVAQTCLVRGLYRVATGRLEGAGEEPLIRDLDTRFAARRRSLRELFVDLMTHETMRLVAPIN